MPVSGGCLRPSLREILNNFHIAAIAIATLLLWSLQWTVQALWKPFVEVGDFLVTAVAILGIPYASPRPNRLDLTVTLSYLFKAIISVVAARLLSRWAYGVGPVRGLSKYGAGLARRDHV